MQDNVYQSTVHISSGKALMANRDEQCGTGEVVILKVEAKLHQTLLEWIGNFNTLIHSSTVRTNHLHVIRYDGKGRKTKKP